MQLCCICYKQPYLCVSVFLRSCMIGSIIPKSDVFGAAAGTLCMIHCIATPFLFIAQSASIESAEATPVWWSSIDYVLLAISFFAVFRSVQLTSKNWIKYGLWLSWIALAAVILNEKFELLSLVESAIYIPALSLVILHLYNRRHCQCETNKCSTNYE